MNMQSTVIVFFLLWALLLVVGVVFSTKEEDPMVTPLTISKRHKLDSFHPDLGPSFLHMPLVKILQTKECGKHDPQLEFYVDTLLETLYSLPLATQCFAKSMDIESTDPTFGRKNLRSLIQTLRPECLHQSGKQKYWLSVLDQSGFTLVQLLDRIESVQSVHDMDLFEHLLMVDIFNKIDVSLFPTLFLSKDGDDAGQTFDQRIRAIAESENHVVPMERRKTWLDTYHRYLLLFLSYVEKDSL